MRSREDWGDFNRPGSTRKVLCQQGVVAHTCIPEREQGGRVAGNLKLAGLYNEFQENKERNGGEERGRERNWLQQ